MKIVLDAGHGYNTAGKRTPDDIREWSLNNAVCNHIANNLKAYGVEVVRTDDTTGKTDISLANRVKKCNATAPALMVSIHHNAFRGTWGNHSGIEVYSHTQGTATDKKLANIIAPLLAKETGLKNRGTKTMQLAILSCKASIPAILCEGGFMDSTVDNPIIISEKGQRAYAKAVTDGIVQFLGLKVVKKEAKVVVEGPTYQVIKGDNLSKIANKFKTTWQDIAKLNNISSPYVIQPGQTIKLPTNTVKPVVKPVAKPKVNYLSNSRFNVSITTALKQLGVNNSYAYRAKLANANGIRNYKGTLSQNVQLLNLLKKGKLIRA